MEGTSSSSNLPHQIELQNAIPNWFDGFLKKPFLNPCPNHDENNDRLNHYCIECGDALCKSYCLPNHKDHPCLRIYPQTVWFDDLTRYFNCSEIQTYSHTKGMRVALKPDPDKRPGKAADEASCRTCTRSMIQCDEFSYCCVSCKVEAIKKKEEDSPLDNQPLQGVTAEEETNQKYDQIAEVRWVNRFLRTRFFEPCPTHNEKEMKEQRWYCIGCEAPHCGHCLIRSCPHISLTEDPSKTCLRIYRHDHRIAVRFDKFHPHFNCSGIQTYVSDKDVLIALHPVQDKRAGEGNCRTCTRSLIQLGKFRYCCLSCKVEASTKKEDDDALVRNANSEYQLSETATKVTEIPPNNQPDQPETAEAETKPNTPPCSPSS